MAKDMEYQYGFDAQGIENLLDEVRGYVIQNAATHAKDISVIKSACDANWEGQSKDDFLVQLQNDANTFASRLTTLYNAFEREVANAGANFSNFDKNLFK